MRRKSGLIVPGQAVEFNDKMKAEVPGMSGCRKRRRRGRLDPQKNCMCGLKLRTRHGETRCLIHGTMWAAKYWELTEVTVT